MAFAAVLAAALLAIPGSASAERPVSVASGNLRGTFNSDFSPAAISRTRPTPIALTTSAKFQSLDGSLVPALREFRFEGDRHASVDVKGIPTCRLSQIHGKDTKSAEAACRPAVVGTGWAEALIAAPAQRVCLCVPPKSLVFNGGERNGVTTLFIHTYVTEPASQAIVATVKIRRIRKGRYGTLWIARVPPLAEGRGSFTSFNLRLQKGVSATCPDGHLNGRGSARFSDGNRLSVGMSRRCATRPARAAAPRPQFFNFGVTPSKLSRTKPRPVQMSITGRYRTEDGLQVPALKELRLEIDRHIALDLEGVPPCRLSGSGPRGDRSDSCPSSVIGRGAITVGVVFPGERVIPTTGSLTVWNSGRKRGGANLIAYAFLSAPVVTELVIPVKVRHVDRGRIGWEARAAIPKIAGGHGSITDYTLTIGRRLLSASCVSYFELRALSTFVDGTRLRKRDTRTCSVAKPDLRK